MQAVVEEEEEHESAGAQRHASSVVRTIAFLFCSDFCCENKRILFRQDTSGRVWTLLLHMDGHGMAEEEHNQPDRAHFQDVGSLVTLLLHTDAQTWHGRRRTRPT